MHNFDYTDGQQPISSMLLLGNRLYGTALGGSTNLSGCIYSIDTNGSGFRVIYSFDSNRWGAAYSTLCYASGKFYGCSQEGAHDSGTVFSIDTSGANYKDIFSFNGPDGRSNGRVQLVVFGYKIYGMTFYGGTYHYGTIFSIDTNGGGFKDIHDFNYSNGAYPYGALMLIGKSLYGMTTLGGVDSDGCIFSIDTSGAGYRILHSFSGNDGYEPYSSLTLSGSTLYATTTAGGTYSSGTIFSIDTSGSGFTNLFNFNGFNGFSPLCNFVISGGVLTGIVEFGGANNDGCIFSIETNGTNFTDLFDFNGANGVQPEDNLFPAGNTLYGTTTVGGYFNDGEVFRFKDTAIKKTETSINELKTNNENIIVYPNPSNGVFNIVIANPPRRMKQSLPNIEIYNMLGEKVYSKFNIQTSTLNIDLSSQPNGIYLYRVLQEDGSLVGSGKVVIQK